MRSNFGVGNMRFNFGVVCFDFLLPLYSYFVGIFSLIFPSFMFFSSFILSVFTPCIFTE